VTDRIFLRLGPNGALGADELQWILYRARGQVPRAVFPGAGAASGAGMPARRRSSPRSARAGRRAARRWTL